VELEKIAAEAEIFGGKAEAKTVAADAYCINFERGAQHAPEKQPGTMMSARSGGRKRF
jgi:hypothetical protein